MHASVKAPQRSRQIIDALHFDLNAIAKVAAVTDAGHQKVPSLFGCLGLNAPLFGARHEHGGVEYC
jgi:hypothetical protein